MSPTILSPEWESALDSLHFSFQPIALSSDGRVYGYEALLRGYLEAGFPGIASIFDSAYLEGVLPEMDRRLQAKAVSDFARGAPEGAKLFYNVDNRLFSLDGDILRQTCSLASGHGISASRIVLELSERHELEGNPNFEKAISLCRELGFRIAIDDFGSGYAGLKLLHMSEPDIVKIDRHFVAGSGSEPRKAAFLEKIVGMAHLMGVTVVAEGVETEGELGVCAESGCDMIQGFLIARPASGREAFASSYGEVMARGAEARRGRASSVAISDGSVREVAPARVDDCFLDVLARFHKEADLDILPVVDAEGEPVGVYLERDFRQYVYSPFGISLLEHAEAASGAHAFLKRAPIVSRDAGLGRVLEVFGALPQMGGVLLTRDSRYAGLLPAAELLALVAERDLAEARDQNPLTRLPGNLRVAEVIARRLGELDRSRAFVYFDFDNFKPFNDRYGFRSGDRVIQLFADILRALFGRADCFVGHLGGDDFFVSFYASSAEAAVLQAGAAADRFRREAASFYSAEDRGRGWILGKDRSEVERKMPLMTVSSALVLALEGSTIDPEGLSDLLASLKKDAKASESRIACEIIDPCAPRRGGERAARPKGEGNPSPAFSVFAPALLYSS